ncbi:hypothetical protein B0H14DRAFT_2976362 [Mycena olivaceomarginata]|nr:hypothetical protein B0H14DRAFT_2976362 [Mycena olivaceomarginata]
MFLPGTRVFYWNGAGQTVYGTVQQVAHMEDGSMVVNIRDDNGQTVGLPASREGAGSGRGVGCPVRAKGTRFRRPAESNEFDINGGPW